MWPAYLEVKIGRMNDEIKKILNIENEKERTVALQSLFQSTDNPKVLKRHIIRFSNQLQRMEESSTYWHLKKEQRVDLKTRREIKVITDNSRKEQSWYITIKELLAKNAGSNKVVCGTVDQCLFFAYGLKPLKLDDKLYFDSLIRQELKLKLSPSRIPKLNIFNTMSSLGQGIATPRSLLYMSQLGKARQQKLLSSEEFLLVFLDIPSLTQLLANAGLKLEVRNMKKEEQDFREPLLSKLFGENRIPVIYAFQDNKKKSMALLGGMWGRIVFGQMPPHELVNFYNFNLKENFNTLST